MSDEPNPILTAIEFGMIGFVYLIIPVAAVFWASRRRRAKNRDRRREQFRKR